MHKVVIARVGGMPSTPIATHRRTIQGEAAHSAVWIRGVPRCNVVRGGYRGGADGVVAVHQAAHAVAAPWEHRCVAIVVILASDGTVI